MAVTEQPAYLLMCAATIAFAAHFPRHERAQGLLVALALVANWLFCELVTAGAPQRVLAAVGIHARGTDLWALGDMAFGAVAFIVGWPRWWGCALWIGAVLWECFHMAHDFGAIEPGFYLWWLDKILLAMCAIFFWVGRRNVWSRISDWAGRLRLLGRAKASLSFRSVRL